jgi:hypothetical protein
MHALAPFHDPSHCVEGVFLHSIHTLGNSVPCAAPACSRATSSVRQQHRRRLRMPEAGWSGKEARVASTTENHPFIPRLLSTHDFSPPTTYILSHPRHSNPPPPLKTHIRHRCPGNSNANSYLSCEVHRGGEKTPCTKGEGGGGGRSQ